MSRGNVRRKSPRVNADAECRAAYEAWLCSGITVPCTPYDAFLAGYVAHHDEDRKGRVDNAGNIVQHVPEVG